jgi:hypothetical protein
MPELNDFIAVGVNNRQTTHKSPTPQPAGAPVGASVRASGKNPLEISFAFNTQHRVQQDNTQTGSSVAVTSQPGAGTGGAGGPAPATGGSGIGGEYVRGAAASAAEAVIPHLPPDSIMGRALQGTTPAPPAASALNNNSGPGRAVLGRALHSLSGGTGINPANSLTRSMLAGVTRSPAVTLPHRTITGASISSAGYEGVSGKDVSRATSPVPPSVPHQDPVLWQHFPVSDRALYLEGLVTGPPHPPAVIGLVTSPDGRRLPAESNAGGAPWAVGSPGMGEHTGGTWYSQAQPETEGAQQGLVCDRWVASCRLWHPLCLSTMPFLIPAPLAQLAMEFPRMLFVWSNCLIMLFACITASWVGSLLLASACQSCSSPEASC